MKVLKSPYKDQTVIESFKKDPIQGPDWYESLKKDPIQGPRLV
jgi:hypothetical protein